MYKKTQTLNDLILWMQDTDDGISLKDIMEKYDVSLRTAVRMKDSIAEKYPKLNEISGPYNTKRWYLPKGTGRDMVSFSMEEIHALQNASKLLASKKMIDSRYIDNVLHKINHRLYLLCNRSTRLRLARLSQLLLAVLTLSTVPFITLTCSFSLPRR